MVPYYAELKIKLDSIFDEARSKQDHEQAKSLLYYMSTTLAKRGNIFFFSPPFISPFSFSSIATDINFVVACVSFYVPSLFAWFVTRRNTEREDLK